MFSSVTVANAQESPVTLIGSVKHLSGDKYELIISAEIDPEWVMYSQNLPKGGPLPTKISFPKSRGYELIGKSKESSRFKKVVTDDIFHLKLTKYHTSVLFRQTVRIKDRTLKIIEADIDYMSCNSYTCLPPTQEKVEFVF